MTPTPGSKDMRASSPSTPKSCMTCQASLLACTNTRPASSVCHCCQSNSLLLLSSLHWSRTGGLHAYLQVLLTACSCCRTPESWDLLQHTLQPAWLHAGMLGKQLLQALLQSMQHRPSLAGVVERNTASPCQITKLQRIGVLHRKFGVSRCLSPPLLMIVQTPHLNHNGSTQCNAACELGIWCMPESSQG